MAEWRSRGGRLDALLGRMKTAASTAQRRRDSAERTLATFADIGTRSVLQAITVQAGWEAAIATALGTWAHTPLAGSPSGSIHGDEIAGFDAWRSSLEREIGPGIWADSIVQGLPSDRTNPLRTTVLVQSDAQADGVWKRLRGLPAHTIGTPPVKVVSREGACWDAVGYQMSSGDDRAASYLRLKREAVTMASRLKTLTARIGRVEAVREQAFTHRRQAEDVVESARAELRSARKQLTELETQVAGLKRQHADLQGRSQELESELEHLTGSKDTLAKEFEPVGSLAG